MDRPRGGFDTARPWFPECGDDADLFAAAPPVAAPTSMSADWIGGGLVALGLLGYLLYALWRAERF
jgi:K+-transporting ATPase KdpF subunit